MNNYSWLEQKLHEFALSSNFMREVAFDAEISFTSPKNNSDDHVFVSGLARSGTTALLNALYQSDTFASLSYDDMPFILAPNLWSKINSKSKSSDLVERAHGDGIKVSTESPEAFEEVFWMTFDENDKNDQQKFKTYVQLINHKYGKGRYLSKNNQNIRRLGLISKLFPCSKILIPFRHPLQHAFSLLSQHKKFIADSKEDIFISNYMTWIGHTEFGPNYIPINQKNLNFVDHLNINHWIEQWHMTYKACYSMFKENPNISFISYEKLCNDKEYWLNILKIVGIDKPYNFIFRESVKEIHHAFNEELCQETLKIYDEMSKLEVS